MDNAAYNTAKEVSVGQDRARGSSFWRSQGPQTTGWRLVGHIVVVGWVSIALLFWWGLLQDAYSMLDLIVAAQGAVVTVAFAAALLNAHKGLGLLVGEHVPGPEVRHGREITRQAHTPIQELLGSLTLSNQLGETQFPALTTNKPCGKKINPMRARSGFPKEGSQGTTVL